MAKRKKDNRLSQSAGSIAPMTSEEIMEQMRGFESRTGKKVKGPLPQAMDELSPPSSPFMLKLDLDYRVASARKGKRRPTRGSTYA
jgi:hypothetical protein